MAEENKVQEAETEAANLPEESGEDKKRKISSEMVIILIIGFLFGIAIKTEVAKRINVADSTFYGKQGYSFAEMQKRLDDQAQAQNQVPDEAPPQ
ncbi:MAG: hypothetical protein AAB487_03460 [Patescibacteria group bacterium]